MQERPWQGAKAHLSPRFAVQLSHTPEPWFPQNILVPSPRSKSRKRRESPPSLTASNTLWNSNTVWSFQSSWIGWGESYREMFIRKTTPKPQSFSLSVKPRLLVISTCFAKCFQLKTEWQSTSKSYQPILLSKGYWPWIRNRLKSFL